MEKTLAIKATGLSNTSFYPQSVTLNGEEIDRSWLSHEELSQGGELVFVLGEEPVAWDVGRRPPSLSEYY
jgi:putative alpha-1,2-mannosidase